MKRPYFRVSPPAQTVYRVIETNPRMQVDNPLSRITFGRATATLRVIAQIRNVGRQMLWQSADWTQHPRGTWHLLRPSGLETECGRVMPPDSGIGRYTQAVADGRVCRVCTR